MEDNKPIGFARGVLSYSGGALAAGILGLISAPITTRVFEPDVLGKVGVFTAYLMFMQILALAGFDQGYMRFAASLPLSREKRLLAKCVRISLILASIVAAGCIVFWVPISLGISSERNFWVVALLIAATAGSVLYRYSLVRSRIRRRPSEFFLLSVTFAFATKYLLVLAGVLGGRHIGAISLLALGYVLAGGLAVFYLRRRTVEDPGLTIGDPISGSQLSRYALPFLGTSLLGWASTSLMPLLILSFAGFAAVGQFNAGLSIVAIVGVVQLSILAYWVPFAFATFSSGALRVRVAQQSLTFVICAVGSVFVMFSVPLSWLLGPEFRATSGFLGLLVAPMVFTLVGEICGVGLLFERRSGLYAVAQAAGTTLTVAMSLALLPWLGLLGAGLAMSSGSLLTMSIRVAFGSRNFRPLTSIRKAAATLSLFSGVVIFQAYTRNFPTGAWGIAFGILAISLMILLNHVEARLIGRSLLREAALIFQKVRRSDG